MLVLPGQARVCCNHPNFACQSNFSTEMLSFCEVLRRRVPQNIQIVNMERASTDLSGYVFIIFGRELELWSLFAGDMKGNTYRTLVEIHTLMECVVLVSLQSQGGKMFALRDKWKTVRVVVLSTHGAWKPFQCMNGME